MTAETKPSRETIQPDPKLLELVKSGHLVPLYRAYSKDEISPEINVIAAFDPNPDSKEVVREIKIFTFSLNELNIVQEFLKTEVLNKAAAQVVDRFFRGLRSSPTVRYLAPHEDSPLTRDIKY